VPPKKSIDESPVRPKAVPKAPPRRIVDAPATAVVRKPKVRRIKERNCSVGRTIDVIGDGWSFMILRECYFGVRRFEKFHEMLRLPRNTLTARLRKLSSQGVLRRVAYSERPLRYEYRLTKVGIALYPVMLALMSFGDKWLKGDAPKPLQLVHAKCGKPCKALVGCSHCRGEILASRTSYRDGPGTGTTLIEPGRRGRRSADPTALERRRPSSVARALQVIGDRWRFMIIREAFFRARRFDEFETKLGIAPNILSDRLTRLVADGVFRRVRYQVQPERFEYRFTEMGMDLFGSMIAMLRWGDDWLSGAEPPLVLTHLDCGADFEPTIYCDQCHEPLVATDMRYKMNYSDPIGPPA